VICNKIMNKSENTPSVTRFSLGFSPNKRFRSIFKDFNSFEILESLEFGWSECLRNSKSVSCSVLNGSFRNPKRICRNNSQSNQFLK
jgi:hypothetical protein